MQKIFTRGEKKLLKSLKMEYFHEVMMKKKNKRLGIEKKKIISKMKVDLMIIKSLIDQII